MGTRYRYQTLQDSKDTLHLTVAGGIVALGGATAAATAAPATLTLTVNSGDPGSDTVFKVKLLGILFSSSDTE